MINITRMMRAFSGLMVMFSILFSTLSPSKGGEGSLIQSLIIIENAGNSKLGRTSMIHPISALSPEQSILAENTITAVLVLINEYATDVLSSWWLGGYSSSCLSFSLSNKHVAAEHSKQE